MFRRLGRSSTRARSNPRCLLLQPSKPVTTWRSAPGIISKWVLGLRFPRPMFLGRRQLTLVLVPNCGSSWATAPIRGQRAACPWRSVARAAAAATGLPILCCTAGATAAARAGLCRCTRRRRATPPPPRPQLQHHHDSLPTLRRKARRAGLSRTGSTRWPDPPRASLMSRTRSVRGSSSTAKTI